SDNVVRQENIETASTVTSIIPASTVIVTQNNQPDLISSGLISLDISNTLQKAKNLANRASYNPSSSSQKGHRCDYGRSQSAKEGQGSVDDLKINKLCHSEAYKAVLPSKRADTATRSLSGHLKASQKAYNNELQHKEYQILSDLWRNCMNSYLTVRKFLGHPNTCKLLNGCHPLMEKKNMMLLKAEWRKNKPTPPKKVPKTAPVASRSN
ncbi:hypothetical protein O181_133642, partial [Austropuccinia psidii MF-1]|nr:hypothetical protein [Austropuccinia psidii MF-1]